MSHNSSGQPYRVNLDIDDSRAAWVSEQFVQFNQLHASPLWYVPHTAEVLQVSILNEKDVLIAGLIGRTNFIPEWLEVSTLWVAENARSQGLGRTLMRHAEEEAKRRGCLHARLSTSHYQAPGFYSKLGYTLYGTLENCPRGETVYYFSKKLS